VNVTYRPLALIAGASDGASAFAPLTRTVVPACRSRRKMSATPLVSPGTTLVASETNATNRASVLMAGA
jgi:hypothetical protein